MALDKTLFYVHVQKYYNFYYLSIISIYYRIDLLGSVIISSDMYVVKFYSSNNMKISQHASNLSTKFASIL